MVSSGGSWAKALVIKIIVCKQFFDLWYVAKLPSAAFDIYFDMFTIYERRLLMKEFVTEKNTGMGVHYATKDAIIRTLCKNGEYKLVRVHRLVASAFIPNTNGYPCVNHKDENKTNNEVANLEWCTYAYNNSYGTVKERVAKARYKPCVGTWPDGTTKRYNSCTIASRETGISQGNIWGACNGLWKTAGGAKWHYA